MLKRIISLACLTGLLFVNAFAHTAVVENGGESRYKSIRLTPEIYNAANDNLSDLRLKDADGEDVPYFIYSGNTTNSKTDRQTYPMTLINSYTKDDSFYFDYKVNDIPNQDIEATSIEIETYHNGFAKSIEVYGSYDDINWEFVQNDTLYSIDDKTKLTVEFNKIQKYTHYRFKLGNNLERISFDSVTLNRNYFTQEEFYFVESITPKFNVDEKNKNTYITVEGLKNLRLGEISIKTDSIFKRMVTAPFGIRKELYNLSFNDTAYTDTMLPFNRQIQPSSTDDTLTLTIDNGDDKPIHITGLTVKYYADELVFEDKKSETYILYFGADNTKTAPVYDIARYQNEILQGDIDRLNITGVALIVEPEPYDYKLIFNIVVIAVAIALGLLILMKLRKK